MSYRCLENCLLSGTLTYKSPLSLNNVLDESGLEANISLEIYTKEGVGGEGVGTLCN